MQAMTASFRTKDAVDVLMHRGFPMPFCPLP